MGVSGQGHAPAAFYPGERTLGTHWTGGRESPRETQRLERKKSFRLCRGSNLIFIFRFLTWRRYKYWYRFPFIRSFHRIRGSLKCFEMWHLMCGERCQFSVQSPRQKTTPGQLSATANHVRYSIHCIKFKTNMNSIFSLKLHNKIT
jgi:hypothetical protein